MLCSISLILIAGMFMGLTVLVGAAVNISYLGKVGINAVLVIIGALVFRMLGVFVCLLGTDCVAALTIGCEPEEQLSCRTKT